MYSLSQTNGPLAQALVKAPENVRDIVLMEAERCFNRGLFTKAASLKDFEIFFSTASINGLITRNSFVNCLDAILDNIYHSQPNRFNYLLRQIYDPFRPIHLPEELIQNDCQIRMISGLDMRETYGFRKTLPFIVDGKENLNPISLSLRLPEDIMDYGIPEYVTSVALSETSFGVISLNFLLTITKSNDPLPVILMSIGRKILEEAGKGFIIEAHMYLDGISEIVKDDKRVDKFQEIFREFLPTISSVEARHKELYLLDFEFLVSMNDDVAGIQEWAQMHEIPKRLKVWFEEPKCHAFLTMYGKYLLQNVYTVKELLEMGEGMWKNLEKFSLIREFEVKLDIFCNDKMLEISNEILVTFYTE